MKLLVALTASLTLTSAALAQEFPSQPVKIVIPFSAGGSTDLIARQLAEELGKIWDQPVLVESRPGAGSMLGTASVAQSAPDGHTLLVTTAAFTTAPSIMDDLPFDPATDITPIAMAGSSPYVIVAGNHVEADSLEDFLKLAQEGSFFVATPGVGSSGHFAGELLNSGGGLGLDVVHFNGGGEAIANLMGGHADLLINTTAAVMPHVRSGDLKPLGILGTQHNADLADLATTAELGHDTPDVGGWIGVMGPGGMSQSLLDQLHADLTRAMQSESFVALLDANFMTASTLSPADFARTVAAESQMWRTLAQERGITRQQ